MNCTVIFLIVPKKVSTNHKTSQKKSWEMLLFFYGSIVYRFYLLYISKNNHYFRLLHISYTYFRINCLLFWITVIAKRFFITLIVKPIQYNIFIWSTLNRTSFIIWYNFTRLIKMQKVCLNNIQFQYNRIIYQRIDEYRSSNITMVLLLTS